MPSEELNKINDARINAHEKIIAVNLTLFIVNSYRKTFVVRFTVCRPAGKRHQKSKFGSRDFVRMIIAARSVAKIYAQRVNAIAPLDSHAPLLKPIYKWKIH